MADGVTHWEGPGLEAWDAWRPDEAAARLRDVEVPWCIVGGWAIDLFVGQETREHEDLELAVVRGDFGAVRAALAGYELYSVGDGEVRRLPPAEQPPADKHQNWVLDAAADRWRVDVMLEPGDHDTWVFRRSPTIRAPRSQMVGVTADGIPFLAPAGALLYKAKNMRPKDLADFDTCLPRLERSDREWLAGALATVHGDHEWIGRLV